MSLTLHTLAESVSYFSLDYRYSFFRSILIIYNAFYPHHNIESVTTEVNDVEWKIDPSQMGVVVQEVHWVDVDPMVGLS